jgi:hypothetical protein
VAERFEIFHVIVAASVTQAAPTTTALSFVDGLVTEVEVIVPPGPSGLSGFQLRYNNVQQIPRTIGAFITTDDEKIKWPIEGFPTGSGWQFTAYNTDINPHTYEIRFLIDELRRPVASLPPLVPIGL